MTGWPIVTYVVAWCLMAAFVVVWLVRTVTAERAAGSAGGPVRRSPALRRLDVALVALAVGAGVACLARMLLILGVV